MNGKKPIAVLTDGDESMQRAVEIVLPGCPHRLLSWHIGENVMTNVKDQKLRERFIEIMYSKHKLSTQLRKLEEDASKIYTDNVFFVVRKEIERVCGLITEAVVQSNGFKTYVMWRHNKVDQRFNVVYFQRESGTPFVCSRQKMEYEGIPCCHIFNVLKHESVTKILSSLVMKRWTISEKCNIEILDTCGLTTNVIEDGESKSRFGYISDMLSKLLFRASSSKEIYEMVSEEVDKLEKKLEAVSIVPKVRRMTDVDIMRTLLETQML
ncbi:hypothetical protein ACLB2K_022821 [Fragaria x ananassa]